MWTDGRDRVGSFDCFVQVRAHGAAVAASVHVDASGVRARLATAQRGVAAGQALVMYDGDTVLGSATISAARIAAADPTAALPAGLSV